MSECIICNRIDMIKDKRNKYFIKELETGYVVIGDFQYFKGYTLFLCKEHVTELHLLDPDFRTKFMDELSLVGEAVYNAFRPVKLNYELLGNGEGGAHMHWHIFPRFDGDMEMRGPVWWAGKEVMYAEGNRISHDELKSMKEAVHRELKKLLD